MHATGPRPAVVYITRGYPYINSVLNAVALAQHRGAVFVPSHGEPASVNRELLVEAAIAGGATHVLLLDDDIVAPLDTLTRLLVTEATVISAAYPYWTGERVAANYQALTDRDWAETIVPRLQPVRQMQLGCVLIAAEVLARVPRPWFFEGESAAGVCVTDREWFCDRVRRAGFRLWCDGRVVCGRVQHGVDLLAVARHGFVSPTTAEWLERPA